MSSASFYSSTVPRPLRMTWQHRTGDLGSTRLKRHKTLVTGHWRRALAVFGGLLMTPQEGYAVMRCHPVHAHRTGSEGNGGSIPAGFRWWWACQDLNRGPHPYQLLPGTAVRTALSPGHARPSGPKVCVQSAHWYAFLRAVLGPSARCRFTGDDAAVAQRSRRWLPGPPTDAAAGSTLPSPRPCPPASAGPG